MQTVPFSWYDFYREIEAPVKKGYMHPDGIRRDFFPDPRFPHTCKYCHKTCYNGLNQIEHQFKKDGQECLNFSSNSSARK